MRDQINYTNLIAGWGRFYGRIIKPKIQGNAKAREIEDEYIENFFKEHGKYPLGNRDRKRKLKTGKDGSSNCKKIIDG